MLLIKMQRKNKGRKSLSIFCIIFISFVLHFVSLHKETCCFYTYRLYGYFGSVYMYILSQSYNNTENKNIYNANVNSCSQRFSVAYPSIIYPDSHVAASLMPNPLICNLRQLPVLTQIHHENYRKESKEKEEPICEMGKMSARTHTHTHTLVRRRCNNKE